MTTILSRPFIKGRASVTDLNRLRHDILEGHDHAEGRGADVNHANLVHPNNYAIVHEHEEIDEHIDALSGVHNKLDNVNLLGVTQGAGTPNWDMVAFLHEIPDGQAVDRGWYDIWFPYGVEFKNTDYIVVNLSPIRKNGKNYQLFTYLVYERFTDHIRLWTQPIEDGTHEGYIGVTIVGELLKA